MAPDYMPLSGGAGGPGGLGARLRDKKAADAAGGAGPGGIESGSEEEAGGRAGEAGNGPCGCCCSGTLSCRCCCCCCCSAVAMSWAVKPWPGCTQAGKVAATAAAALQRKVCGCSSLGGGPHGLLPTARCLQPQQVSLRHCPAHCQSGCLRSCPLCLLPPSLLVPLLRWVLQARPALGGRRRRRRRISGLRSRFARAWGGCCAPRQHLQPAAGPQQEQRQQEQEQQECGCPLPRATRWISSCYCSSSRRRPPQQLLEGGAAQGRPPPARPPR